MAEASSSTVSTWFAATCAKQSLSVRWSPPSTTPAHWGHCGLLRSRTRQPLRRHGPERDPRSARRTPAPGHQTHRIGGLFPGALRRRADPARPGNTAEEASPLVSLCETSTYHAQKCRADLSDPNRMTCSVKRNIKRPETDSLPG